MVMGVVNRRKGVNKNGRKFCICSLPQFYLGCFEKESVNYTFLSLRMKMVNDLV